MCCPERKEHSFARILSQAARCPFRHRGRTRQKSPPFGEVLVAVFGEILVYRVKHGLAAFAVKRTEFFDMRGKVVTRQELIRHHLREHGRMNVRNLLCYNHFCDKVAVTRYVADADSRGQNF